MPICEYRCGHCSVRLEVLVWSGGGGRTCPHCGSPLLDRLLSVPFISRGSSPTATTNFWASFGPRRPMYHYAAQAIGPLPMGPRELKRTLEVI
jgi:putative FmdB family regulatory protein